MDFGLLAIITAKDLGFIENDEMLKRLRDSIETIDRLEKWNGHLYNWYDVTTALPLNPKFVSTVDSGNFVGYLYVVKKVLEENHEEELKNIVEKLIKETDFSYLYDHKKGLFSIGFDDKEKKLVDSYYDLLASEARQASFVAIAKRDVPYKHWFYLGRTLTTVDGYKGLVSWAGTMFEYFMPLIVMKSYDYTLLEETYKFCVYSQKRYAKKLNIPWGISESAFSLQDLNYNYQYKAFGIPWLGLKRGLKDEFVVSPYASILAISEAPRDVMKNIEVLKKIGAYDKFGFYESIDYTPSRVKDGYTIVKTYMAHHQALILLSINNFLNDNILQQRFNEDPEIKSAQILLQEKVPERVIFTKEKKEKIKFTKYKDYEDYSERVIHKDEGNVNILSGDNYTLLINDRGEGYSETDGILITKNNEVCKISNCIFIKDKNKKKSFSNTLKPLENEVPDEYNVSFSPAICKFYRRDGNIETITRIVVSSEDRVELRQLEIRNIGEEEVNLDVISYQEPIITDKNSDIVHPVYNSLFLRANNFDGNVLLEKRFHNGRKMYYTNFAIIPENPEAKFEIELDKAKIIGRGRTLQNPLIIEQDKMFSNNITSVANTVIALKKNITLKENEKIVINYYGVVGGSEEEIKSLYEKYTKFDSANRMFELAIGRSLIENRFLGFKGKEVVSYNKILAEVINGSSSLEKYEDKIIENRLKQSDLWKFGISGDLPMILVKINDVNDSFVIKKLVRATEYFYHKKIKIDLVILNGEENSYEQYVNEKIFEVIGTENANYLLNVNGGIHVLKEALMTRDEVNLIYSCSDMIIEAGDGI